MRSVFAVLLSAMATLSTAYDQKDLNEEMVIAANWQQLSGEYDAYLYQTFNSALERLKQALPHVPKDKKPAIVTDIDETLLSGSRYFSSLVGTQNDRSIERSRNF